MSCSGSTNSSSPMRRLEQRLTHSIGTHQLTSDFEGLLIFDGHSSGRPTPSSPDVVPSVFDLSPTLRRGGFGCSACWANV